MSFLVVENLSKRYGPVAALQNVSLVVSQRSRTAVVGPSGSGKSTLLRLLAGFEMPDSGRIQLGEDLLAVDGRCVAAHRREIGIVAQEGALFPHLTVGENIGFGLPRNGPDKRDHVARLLDAVELPRAMLQRKPHELSGGQQQRVALARALARKPRLMLLDEPFSALDAGLRQSTRVAVAGILDDAEIACILVTHDQQEALSFADHVAILHDGRLMQAGTPQELYHAPRDTATAAFLGDLIVMPADIRDGIASCRLGRLPTTADAADGHAAIMLRPEQVQIRPAGSGPGGSRTGIVRAVTFGGTLSTVTLDLEPPDADTDVDAANELAIPVFSIDAPPIGARVQLVVRGAAHVFPRDR